jgi:hypothetical protein
MALRGGRTKLGTLLSVAGIGAIAFTAVSVSGFGAAAQGSASGVHNADQAGPDEFSQFGLARTAPGLSVPGEALAAAQAQAAQLPLATGSWKELTTGTDNLEPAGFTDLIWSNIGAGFRNTSGRVTALAVDGTTIYAGAADGGVWKSTDSGAHWKPIADQLATLSIGALAINPKDDSLWVGTGEANTNSDSYQGQGVFRYSGGTFTQVGGFELLGRTTYRLVFDGEGSVYAATSGGLWRRSAKDLSSAWTLVLKPDPNPTGNVYKTSFITDVVIRPGTDGKTVLAADGWRGAGTAGDTAYNGFYLSTTGGGAGTFSKLALTGAINAGDIGRTTFAYAADGSKLYAVVESPSALASNKHSVLQGVFLSGNGDPVGPWTLIADSTKLCNSGSACPTFGLAGVQAWYNEAAIVDPNNPSHFIFGLEEDYQTFDAGATFTTINPYWNYNFACDADIFHDACAPVTHPDQHAIAISGNTLFIGNDGGVYSRGLEDTAPNGDWTDLNDQLHTLQYYDAQAGKSGSGIRYWGGLQDNGDALTYGNGTSITPAGGDGGQVIVDPTNANKSVGEYVFLNMYLTTDGGHNFRTITPSCASVLTAIAGCDPNPRFIAPMATDVNNPHHWVAGGQFVWDDTEAWSTVCNPATTTPPVPQKCDWTNIHDTGAHHSITAIAVNGSTIYAAWCGPCNAGGAAPFASGIDTNAGGTWHTISASNLPDRFIQGLTVDPNDASHVYVVYNGFSRRWIPSAGVGHVFESSDGGATFTDISVLLPDIPSDALVLTGGHLYLGTDIGAFVASVGGGNNTAWARLGTGLPNVVVNDIRLNPDGKKLLAATHGRGLWTFAIS